MFYYSSSCGRITYIHIHGECHHDVSSRVTHDAYEPVHNLPTTRFRSTSSAKTLPLLHVCMIVRTGTDHAGHNRGDAATAVQQSLLCSSRSRHVICVILYQADTIIVVCVLCIFFFLYMARRNNPTSLSYVQLSILILLLL